MSQCLSFRIRYSGIRCEGVLRFPLETSDQDRRRLYDETVRVTGQASRVSSATFTPGLVEDMPPAPPAPAEPAFELTDDEREIVLRMRAGTVTIGEPKPAKKEAKAKPAKAAPKAAKAAKKAPPKKARATKQGELNI